MTTIAVTFLDHDVEIHNATRHDDCVAVTVKDQDGVRVELYLHEDVWSLLYEAALDAPQYQPPAPVPPLPGGATVQPMVDAEPEAVAR